LLDDRTKDRARPLWRFLRPATLPAPVTGIVGGAVAAAAGWPPPGRLALAVASAVLLTGASNGVNQIADVETDRINRPDRPLPSGALSVATAWRVVGVQTLLSFGAAFAVNLAFAACVVVTLPVTAAYSLPPLRTKRIPFLANATIATPRGLLLVVAGWAVGGGALRPEAWLLGAVAWLYIFGAATTKDFADVEGDQATGCRTLPIALGTRPAARFVAPFLFLPFLAYPLFAVVDWLPGPDAAWTGLGAGIAVLGIIAATLLLRRPAPPADGGPHPAWKLMYLQLTAAPIGAAMIFAGWPA